MSLKKFIAKNAFLLIVLVIGSYLVGLNIGFLMWFFPILQLLAICAVIGLGIAMLTQPVEFMKAIVRLYQYLRRKIEEHAKIY